MGTAGAAFRRGARKETPGESRPTEGAPLPSARQGGGTPYGGGEGEAFLKSYLFGEGNKQLGERKSMRAAVGNAVETRAAAMAESDPTAADDLRQMMAFKDLDGVPGTKQPYQLYLHDSQGSLEAAAKKMSGSGYKVTPEQLKEIAVNTYGGTEDEAVAEMLRQGMENQKITEPHIQGMVKGARRVAGGIGQELIAENPSDGLYQALGIDKAMLAKRYGADVGMPEWLPRMQNLSPVQTGMAYGLAAAGAGAGAIALANHLAAKGQQQQSPVDYAAAVQALNAYA